LFGGGLGRSLFYQLSHYPYNNYIIYNLTTRVFLLLKNRFIRPPSVDELNQKKMIYGPPYFFHLIESGLRPKFFFTYSS
jgi:hypothetical protein